MTIKITKITAIVSLAAGLLLSSAFADTMTSTTTTATPAAVNTTPTPAVTTTTSTSTTPSNTATAQPIVVVSQANVMDFAQKAVMAAFSYDYQNYQQSLQKMQSYFTKSGWDSFSKALSSSNNLDVVQKEKLTVTAALNGQMTVTQDQQTATGQNWQVTVPVIVTYQNDKNQNIKQDLMIKLAIITVSTDVNPTGLGVDQFIAMPAVAPATTPAQ